MERTQKKEGKKTRSYQLREKEKNRAPAEGKGTRFAAAGRRGISYLSFYSDKKKEDSFFSAREEMLPLLLQRKGRGEGEGTSRRREKEGPRRPSSFHGARKKVEGEKEIGSLFSSV